MTRISSGYGGPDFDALRALVEEHATEDLARLARVTASFAAAAPDPDADEVRAIARAASVSTRSPVARAAARRTLTKERIASHFNPSTRHDAEGGRDRLARVKPGTLLRDQNGNPMYNGTVPGRQEISIAAGAGRVTIQRHPVIRDAAGNLMVYVWGNRGKFEVGGKPSGNYSGWIRRDDLAPEHRGRFPTHTIHRNRVDGPWGAALKKHVIGERTISPRPIAGRHVGMHGTANHPLDDYGLAHGKLEQLSYATMSVLGTKTGAGQVGAILPKGTKVQATDITKEVPNTRGGDLKFRLCIVEQGPPHLRAKVALWIADPVLKR